MRLLHRILSGWFGILLLVGVVRGQGQWVACQGEAAVLNVTYEEAQVLALRRARLDAIEQVCGVSLQAESMVKNFMMAGDFIHSISYGQVVEERNHNWKTEEVPSETPSAPPVLLLRVSMEARVIPVTEPSDPYFKLSLNINRSVFESGDEVVLKVKSTKDCYLTILNWAANDSVYILLPNEFDPDGLVQAGSTTEIPNRRLREAGVHFRVATLPGHTQDTEMIKVVATKQKAAFFDELEMKNGFGIMGTPKMAVAKMARWLSEIPVSERAEASQVYTIHANK